MSERPNASRGSAAPGPVLLLAALLGFLGLFVLTAPWTLLGREVGRLSAALSVALGITVAFFVSRRRHRVAVQEGFLRGDFSFSRRQRLAAGGLLFLFFLRVAVSKYRALKVNAWDFSLFFDRPIEETLHGLPLWCADWGQSYLGIHASYVLFAFVPLYALAASPVWLLLAQAAAFAGASVAAFSLLRRLGGDDLAAALLALGFALNGYTAKAAQYVFHVEVFYPFGIFLLLWAFAASRPRIFAVALAFLLSIKEDAVLPCAGFAMTAVLLRRPRWAAAALLAGVCVFVVDVYLVMPFFSGSAAGQPWYSSFWGSYGETPLTAAAGMAAHPVQVARDLSRSGIRHLLEPLLFLPPVGWEWFVAALPALLPYALASNTQLAQFGLYYSLPVLPFLFASLPRAILRVARLRNGSLPPRVLRSRYRLGALLVFLFCALDGAGYMFERPHPARTEIAPLLATLEPDREVRVQGALLPHAGYARNRRALAPETLLEADEAVLLLPEADPYPFTREALAALRERLSNDSRYALRRGPEGLLLFVPKGTTGARPRNARRERGGAEARVEAQAHAGGGPCGPPTPGRAEA